MLDAITLSKEEKQVLWMLQRASWEKAAGEKACENIRYTVVLDNSIEESQVQDFIDRMVRCNMFSDVTYRNDTLSLFVEDLHRIDIYIHDGYHA